MMTFYPSNGLLIIKNDFSKIVKAYSGAIAKIMWQNETDNNLKLKFQTMAVSKQWLENRIKELNDWLLNDLNFKHPDFPINKQKRDYYVRKLIELEENQITSISV